MKPISEGAKLLGNASFGNKKSIEFFFEKIFIGQSGKNVDRHTDIKIMSARETELSMLSPYFMALEEFNENCFEVQLSKEKIVYNVPFMIALSVNYRVIKWKKPSLL